MKKWLCVLLAGVLVLGLSACGGTPDVSSEDPSGDTTTTTLVQSTAGLPAHFAALLENQQQFSVASYFGDSNPLAYNLSSYLAKQQDTIRKYALLDMDGDGEQELILELDREEDKLIISKSGSSLYGYSFSLRGMYRIDCDGTFYWNSNAGKTYGCSKLQFAGSDYEEIELWRVEHGENDSYVCYVDDKAVSEDYFNSVTAEEKDEVDWVQWTDSH
ncbi:MAG: hypothetical protein IJC33_02285 [Clostridia bacterium]|nr:hypothetical protein [Clostridia bacterium]